MDNIDTSPEAVAALLARCEKAEARMIDVTREASRQVEFSDSAYRSVCAERDDLRANLADLQCEHDQLGNRLTETGQQLTAAQAREARLREALTHLADVARQAVAYVGAANYRERQIEAEQWIDNAESAALAQSQEQDGGAS